MIIYLAQFMAQVVIHSALTACLQYILICTNNQTEHCQIAKAFHLLSLSACVFIASPRFLTNALEASFKETKVN